MIEKYASERRRYIIKYRFGSNDISNIDIYYKININVIKNFVINVLRTPFRLSFNNLLNWSFVVVVGGYFDRIRWIILNVRTFFIEYKEQIFSALDILVKYQTLIYGILGIIGISRIYHLRVKYRSFYHDQIGYYRRCQNRVVGVLSEIFCIEYENLKDLDHIRKYLINAFIESITGITNYRFENGELKFGKSYTTNCTGLNDYKDRLKSWDGHYERLSKILNELHDNNEWRYFAEANYYNKYEFYRLFSPIKYEYLRNTILDGCYFNKIIENHTEANCMNFFYDNISEILNYKLNDSSVDDDFMRELEYQETKLIDKIEKFQDKLNRNICDSVEQHLLLKRYMNRYDNYHNNPLVHDIIHFASKFNFNYA
jgi:hypothetical protein